MLTLSDDKSAYGTLKGLVQAIQEDIRDIQYKRNNYSERSLDYARATGEIGGYNLTISLIMSSDVWVSGQREEAAPKTEHYHVATPDGSVYTGTNAGSLRDWLASRGVNALGVFDLLTLGYSVTHCQLADCHPSEATPMRAHLERTTPAPTRTHR
jgi:hypothetical protein